MVLISFTYLQRKKKKRFDREEDDGEDGFILIHLIGKKMGLNEKKRMWRMVLFPFILLQRKKEKKRSEREEEDSEDKEMGLG